MITQQESLICSNASTRWYIMYCDHQDAQLIVGIESTRRLAKATQNIHSYRFYCENESTSFTSPVASIF